MRFTFGVVICLMVAQLFLSGCLGEQFRQEPYEWQTMYNEKDIGDGEYSFNVPERTDRIVVEIDAEVALTVPVGGIIGISVSITSPDGVYHNYTFDSTDSLNDTFVHVPSGEWKISVTDYTRQNKVSIKIDAYVPKHKDWAWWKIWM